MKLSVLWVAAFMLLVCSLQALSSLHIECNDTVMEVHDTVMKEQGFNLSKERAAVLGELLPLLSSVDSCEVVTTSGETIDLPFDTSALQLFQTVIIRKDGSYSLEGKGITVEEVKRITVTGKTAAQDGIEVWLSWEGVEEISAEIDRFARTFTIPVTVREVPRIENKVITYERAGGTMPDMVMVQPNHLPSYLAEGVLQAAALPEGLAGADAFISRGVPWAVPFYTDCQVIVYNPELIDLKDMGTLQDFEHQLEEAKTVLSRPPAAWNMYSAYWLVSFLYGFGLEEFIGDDGSVNLHTPAAQKAISYLISLKNRGLAEAVDREGMTSSFLSGNRAVILTGSYMLPRFEALGISYALAPYPRRGEQGTIAPLLDYKGLAVTQRAANPQAARLLAAYLASPRVQRELLAPIGKLPVDPGAYQVTAEESPFGDVLLECKQRGKIVPPDPSYNVFLDVMWGMLRFMIDGRIAVSQGLQRAQQMIDLRLEEIDAFTGPRQW